LVGVSVYAIDTWDTGSRVEWSWPWKCVYYNGWSNKMRITKSAWSAIFVPTKTNTEFAAFHAHMPSGVTTWSGIGQCDDDSQDPYDCSEWVSLNHENGCQGSNRVFRRVCAGVCQDSPQCEYEEHDSNCEASW
jgi:hypothetical protein